MWCVPSAAGELAGRIVSLHDGDTVTLRDEKKHQYEIRLAGIDAPELGQPYGQASRRHLAEVLSGKLVTVHVTKMDR